MKLSTLKKDIWYLIVYILGVLGCLMVASSCTSVKKLRSNVHQETVKTETVQKSDTKDSTSKTITKTIDSSGNTITIDYDSTAKDTAIVFEIITYPSESGLYFERISVKSSVKPKSIRFTQSVKKQAETLAATTLKTEKKQDVKKEEKVVSKVKTVEKKKFKVPVTLMIIIIVAIIALIVAYKYRKQIKLFIIKLPFKFLP